MRRAVVALVALVAVALGLLLASGAVVSVPAQIPPSIKKPIEAAKKAAAGTNKQTQMAEKAAGADSGKAAALPAEAAQGGAKGGTAGTGAKGARGSATPQADSIRAKAAADSAARRGSASQGGGKGTLTFYREEFTYLDEGRRDPFVSLMASGELRPLLVDLSLIGLLYDSAAPNRSVAVLEDVTTRETWRVQVGNILGRMKVVKIGAQDITFSIDEFGFSRQETLPLDISRRAGGQPGRRPQ